MDVLDKSVEYDKALARAKELINEKSADVIRRKIIEHIFPQLKETVEENDVRISKSIIRCLKAVMPDNEYRREYISWLEKRGSMMTHQEEHKFNIGEWIIYDMFWLKVVDIKPNKYVLQFPDGNETTDNISHVDKVYRLWTIEDAKAGDVLYSPSTPEGDKEYVFIFKEIDKNGIVKSYALLQGEHLKISNAGSIVNGYAKAGYHIPTTKEQRELLFERLKEEGYKWSAMKKELVCDTNSSGM